MVSFSELSAATLKNVVMNLDSGDKFQIGNYVVRFEELPVPKEDDLWDNCPSLEDQEDERLNQSVYLVVEDIFTDGPEPKLVNVSHEKYQRLIFVPSKEDGIEGYLTSFTRQELINSILTNNFFQAVV